MASDESTPTPNTTRSGSQPSAGNYVSELPLAEELQALLGAGYIVEGFLGQGGMGAVYKGFQMPLKRPVAIKILQRKGEDDDFGFEERFKREAYAMAGLTHPNIVQVYDCGDAGENFLFISMELVEGGDLSDAIKAGLTPDAALKLIPQICDGLQAAHERGIVHRDIKPANIFLTKDGRAKVADFGLAKKFDVQNTFATKTGMSMGTPDYAAPEQYDAVTDIDHRADIYALGVMMYQMITGALPRGNYKPASQRAGTDPRIDAILGKAMENERADRHQSAAEIKAEFAAIVAPAPKISASPSTKVPLAAPSRPASTPVAASTARAATMAPKKATTQTAPAAPAKKRGGMGATLGILAAVAALAIGAWVMMKRSPSSSAPGAAARKVDLLAQVNLARDKVSGEWTQRPEGLRGGGSNVEAVLEIPYEPPAEYDFEIEFTRERGSVVQLLAAHGKSFAHEFTSGGSAGEQTKVGFTQVDGKSIFYYNEATVRILPPPAGKRCVAVIQVRQGSLRSLLDGQEIVSWKGDFSRLSLPPKRELRGQNHLGLGSWNGSVIFHRATVHEVSGAGKFAESATPVAAAKSAPPAAATKDAPFVNSLGMKFVPVPIKGGPTDGRRVLFSVWETRVQDYQTFITGTQRKWRKARVLQDDTHPAVVVSWEDARAFCEWLTQGERRAGRLGASEAYRLPSDHEWSCAVGIGALEDASLPPSEKNCMVKDHYAWGTQWPPPPGAGNYAGEESRNEPTVTGERLTGYHDNFPSRSPVGIFTPNVLGLFDLGGNVREWCADPISPQQVQRVQRGDCMANGVREDMISSFRTYGAPDTERAHIGFRCVLAENVGVAAPAAAPR